MLARLNRFAVGTVVLVVLPLLVSGCGGETETSPTSDAAPYSQTDVRIGTGAEALSGSVVSANYAGWFYDQTKPEKKGVQFASSTSSGPAEFAVGTGVVIEGWERGVVGMKEGGIRRLVIPPSLAYGSARYAVIPPNTTVVFEIELVTVVVPSGS